MPINEALFAAMKAASYIKPNAGKSYKLQRVAEELIAKQAPDNPKCRVEDAFAPMADGYAVPLRVFTPLVAYGAPLPEALEESSANGTPVASAISAILPAVLPKVLPKILIKESTSSGNADGISGNANTELPSVTPRGTILFFHGGGWTTGGINLYTQACAHMAVRLQRRVISVEYRLAPEYRFPTAVEDCYEVARQLFAGELPISGVGGGTVAAVHHPQSASPTAPPSSEGARSSLCGELIRPKQKAVRLCGVVTMYLMKRGIHMASRWTDVERVEQGALPTMLAQAVIAGTALTVGAIACSGFYLSMIGNVAALLPWATIVILIAVAFTYIVGFALLWCAEALTLRANDKLKPWLYGVVGLIGYGVWGMFVMSAMMNTLNQPLNGVVLSNGDVMALTVNYAVFGFIAFLLAQAYAPKIATKKGLTIGLMVVQIVLAIIGIIVLVMMFSALSH